MGNAGRRSTKTGERSRTRLRAVQKVFAGREEGDRMISRLPSTVTIRRRNSILHASCSATKTLPTDACTLIFPRPQAGFPRRRHFKKHCVPQPLLLSFSGLTLD